MVEATREIRDYPYDYIVCTDCEGYQGGVIIPLNIKRCRCRTLGQFGLKNLDEADPLGLMTFDSISDPHPTLEQALGRCRQILAGEAERGMFMFGEPGVGKTHLAVATVRAACDVGIRAGYFNMAELVSRTQETYGKEDGTDTRFTIIQDVAHNQLVALDDIGKEHRSSDVESIIYELINGIYTKRRMLIASSNLPADVFAGRYDDAVKSRLRGLCDRITILGDDRRPREWSW